ncbi:MAG: ATP-binding protein [Gemmatimonadota bacterium]|jgi:signal transduction histidine kinase
MTGRAERVDDGTVVDRLAALPLLADVPRQELEWLVQHGDLRVFEPGEVIAPRGKRIETLWVVMSGHLAVRVDRGVGPRRVIEWHSGELSGMLPYSRMKGPPGHNYAEERTELLMIHEDQFPEMINRCPTVTAKAVHAMVDRARRFNTSDLQDEKMLSLGRLAAGLAHELNNPAAATVRAAKSLLEGMSEADAAARAFAAAGLTAKQLEAVERLRESCSTGMPGNVFSPIELSDREDEIVDWLEDHGVSEAPASALVDTSLTVEDLDELASEVSGEDLDVTLRWLATDCSTSTLATDIERAATRISDLVGAIKRFTHMDNLAGPESVDVEPGLRDTLRVIASKSKSKGATVSLDIAPDLPCVRANGGELNQIWLNLIDNALDAINEGGRIDIRAELELDHVVVRVVDDGPGIPPEVLPHIFDPFVTTKPPGQGTGLGLEIALRLARSYQGDITVESEPGRTEFAVSLPLDEAKEAGAEGDDA